MRDITAAAIALLLASCGAAAPPPMDTSTGVLDSEPEPPTSRWRTGRVVDPITDQVSQTATVESVDSDTTLFASCGADGFDFLVLDDHLMPANHGYQVQYRFDQDEPVLDAEWVGVEPGVALIVGANWFREGLSEAETLHLRISSRYMGRDLVKEFDLEGVGEALSHLTKCPDFNTNPLSRGSTHMALPACRIARLVEGGDVISLAQCVKREDDAQTWLARTNPGPEIVDRCKSAVDKKEFRIFDPRRACVEGELSSQV